MDCGQERAPLLEALLEYARSSPCRFHVPGHGGGRGAPEDLLDVIGRGVFDIDATELPGLDDLNSPAGVIARAQELAARAFGAGRSFFLVNGTTQGLQALILAAGRPGGRVILPRNSHRSVIGGLVLAGLDPVFVTPAVVPGFNFAAGVPSGEIARAAGEHPDACAVLCVHPNYYGAVGDTQKASALAHAAGMPLLADEAHGCHLYFHQGYPAGALQAGADAAVQSMHKTGGSLTQSSLLHLRGSLLDGDRVFSALKLMQTSSPSYVLMASLDAARRRMALNGRDLLERLLQAVGKLRDDLAVIRGIEVFGPDHLDGDGIFDYDPSRVVVRVSGLGLTGRQAADWLGRRRGVYVEMADRDNIVLVPGLGVTREDCRRAALALKDLAAGEGRKPVPDLPGPADIPPPRVLMNLREAWFAASRPVRVEEAAGEACAEWVAVYPPGIPVVLPGEEVTPEMVNYLIRAREAGAGFQGPSDPALKFLRIISG
ncbi:MAG: DegT/DnrJ/EryC1/StrS family aminotransferase [Peptococcaceae bacterium]|nr:DegT/DnrJ/EryC1/StrS family aminotransferase [Peptococcaceae bacterium]